MNKKTLLFKNAVSRKWGWGGESICDLVGGHNHGVAKPKLADQSVSEVKVQL